MAPEHDGFERGIELFNAGRFFECHEVWEEVWKRADGDSRRFYQGLIQLAVAILHTQRANYRGAASVLAKARRNLDGVPDAHMGVEIGRLRREVATFVEARGRTQEPIVIRSEASRG